MKRLKSLDLLSTNYVLVIELTKTKYDYGKTRKQKSV